MMMSARQITYRNEPLNPYRAEHDSQLQSRSDFETRDLYELDTDHKRGDWHFQRARRNAKPTNEDLKSLDGLLVGTRWIPRFISCRSSYYPTLISSRVIKENIGLVIAYHQMPWMISSRTQMKGRLMIASMS